MATATPVPSATARPPGGVSPPGPGSFAPSIWQGPLVPVALAGTAGIVLDRLLNLPLLFTLIAAAAALAGWAMPVSARREGQGLIYLWAGIAAVGAAYHHYSREVYAGDDLGYFASTEPRPVLLRGLLESEPAIVWQVHN